MPRIETPLSRDRCEQPLPLLALDRLRAQAPATVPGEVLVEGPLAETAIAVVQDHQLLPIAAHPAVALGAGSGGRTSAAGAGRAKRVGEQHRDRHRPPPAWNRRDRSSNLGGRLEVDVADEAVVGAVHADVDDG